MSKSDEHWKKNGALKSKNLWASVKDPPLTFSRSFLDFLLRSVSRLSPSAISLSRFWIWSSSSCFGTAPLLKAPSCWLRSLCWPFKASSCQDSKHSFLSTTVPSGISVFSLYVAYLLLTMLEYMHLDVLWCLSDEGMIAHKFFLGLTYISSWNHWTGLTEDLFADIKEGAYTVCPLVPFCMELHSLHSWTVL